MCRKNHHRENGRNSGASEDPAYERPFPESTSPETIDDHHVSKRFTIPGALAGVAAVAIIAMTLYEVVKQMVFSGISVWESHTVTILFTTVVATVAAYFIVRRYNSYIRTISEEKVRRQRSEQILKESEIRYRLIFETAGAAMIITDSDMNIIDVDTTFCLISGYSREDFDRHTSWNDVIISSDIGTMEQYYRSKARHPDSFPNICELRLITKGGAINTVLLSAVPIPGTHRYMTAILDITEQKKVEGDLRKREEQLRTFLNSTSDMAFLKDDHYRYVFANTSIAEFFGKTEGEIIGKTDFHLMEHPAAEKFRSYDEKAHAINTIVVNEEVIGDKVFEITRFPVPAGDNGIGLGGYIRDISDRRKAESDLKQSEEKHRTTLETIEEGYYQVDLAGNFIFFNKAMCDLLGYSREELMGKNSREYTSPETAWKLYRTFNTVYKSGVPIKDVDFEMIRKDGTKKNIELSVTVKRSADGSVVGFRGMARDVTERTKAQEERKKLERQLRQARKMEAVGTLAAGVAHNFNNILMGIQGNTSLILLQNNHNERSHRRLGEIEKLVQRGALLTSQILGYAREGKYEVKYVDINKILQNIIYTFEIAKKEIQIHCEFADDITSVLADQEQVEQVFMNIYINAAEAMPQGGDLYIKTMNVTHEYMTDRVYDPEPGRYVLVSITDTGEGMSKKTMNRIFEPFFTSKGLGKGKGMSLASAYGIVKAHLGYIDVFSKRKQGSTFEIFLPASDEDATTGVSIIDQLVRGEETILLVDDEEMILDIGEQMLEALGYDVLTAVSGLEAIEVYKNNQDDIDMIVLDMIMPGMSGGDVYDMLKSRNQDVKVLLASGYSIDGQATEILERGCSGFIQKPFDMRRLSTAIRRVLGGTGKKNTEYH